MNHGRMFDGKSVASPANIFLALLLWGGVVGTAQAHIIDRVEVNRAGNEAEIRIEFDTRVQFLRDSSLGSGEIHIYFNLLEPDPSIAARSTNSTQPQEMTLVSETKDSPPSDIAPHFVITYPELDSALDIKFDQEVEYRVRPGQDNRSISVFIPLPSMKALPEPPPQPALRTPEEIEQEAKQLIDAASDAMVAGQLDTAIEKLNRLLNLPPNQQSQRAQKLIGEAREKNGEYGRARVEYELYLKLYPDAVDATQVKQRLAKLPAEGAKPKEAVRRKTAEEGMMVYGSLAQYYYKGAAHTESTTSSTQSSWSGTDLSTLISSLDLTARKRTETTDTRFVVRDTYNANYVSGQISRNRLAAAYVEQSGRDRSYLYRAGRQPGNAGGVLGNFDGLWLGHNVGDTWRLNGVFGSPVDYYSTLTDRKTLAGISLDLMRLPEQWSGSAYLIQQRVAGVTDRKAVGLEAHYFDMHSNYSTLLDYDTIFKAFNIATVQGNWITASGSNYNLLVDHRKSPPLQLTNVLPAYSAQSISAALTSSGGTLGNLRSDAKALTSISNMVMVGTTQPYSKHWRVGGDLRVTNQSGTDAVGTMPAALGTGNIYMVTIQATGNSVLIENDMNLVSLGYITGKYYKAESLSLNRVEPVWQNWRIDMSLQYYIQHGQQPSGSPPVADSSYRQTRLTPSLKAGYRLNDAVSFEAEAALENTHTSSSFTGSSDSARHKYYYVGYRWDFR